MNFDTLLKKHVGEFGTFQILIMAIILYYQLFVAFHTMGPVFLAAEPKHWCKDTEALSLTALSNCSIEQLVNITVPPSEDGFQSCTMYKRNYTALAANSQLSCGISPRLADEVLGNDTTSCSEWFYDTSQYSDTVTTQWNFVCDGKWKRSTASSAYIAGLGIGGVISGWFSDRFGRRKIALIGSIVNISCSLIATFCPVQEIYFIARFIQGACIMGGSSALFVLCNELAGASKRTMIGVILLLGWSLGCVVLSGISYAMRFSGWKNLNLILTLPEVLFVLAVIFFVPESPRWLYNQQRHKEAGKIVARMAKWNKRSLPEALDVCESTEEPRTTSLVDLFRTPNIRIVTIILLINWSANGFIFYGLSLNTSELGGNPYLNFLISSAVEILGGGYQLLLYTRFGRLIPYSVNMFAGGIVFLSISIVPSDLVSVIITLSTLGKLIISATFGMLWTYSPEAYPTCVRNQGLLMASLGSRAASFLSPYIFLLARYSRILPFLIYGGSALLAGGLFLLLPETKNKTLTQTINDGEAFIPKNRIKFRQLCAEGGSKKDIDPIGSADDYEAQKPMVRFSDSAVKGCPDNQ